MFFVLLKFSNNRAAAAAHMEGHNAWIRRGFEDGVFLLAGTIQPKQGGCVVAHNTTMEALQKRVSEDPFVMEDVVLAEIIEISPGKTDPRLDFLAA